MTTDEQIRPIIIGTYGDNGMSRALVFHLAQRIEEDDWDSRGREYGVMRACWDWFSGGTTAASTARKIEEALAPSEDCPVCDGTGRSNPLPVPRTGPGPCRHCAGTGKRPTSDGKQAA